MHNVRALARLALASGLVGEESDREVDAVGSINAGGKTWKGL